MPTAKLVPASYKRLISEIAELYQGARKAVVEAYWQIGRRIVLVEQQGGIQAAYGADLLYKVSQELFKRLGRDFSESHLRRIRQFYLANPICAPAHKLTWAHHVELLSIHDPKKRLGLERRVEKEGLNRDEVRVLVRREQVREQVAANIKGLVARPSGLEKEGFTRNESRVPSRELLIPPKDLTLGTYRKGELSGVASGNGPVLDCGFYVYREVTKAQYRSATVTDKPAYAYAATVERVIDGDTLWAVIDVGFGTRVREKLRLRGLDCPELGTPEGESAKRFAQKLLPAGTPILLKTTRSEDKYGRYVADVFIGERYLNNLLLQEGLAIILKE